MVKKLGVGARGSMGAVHRRPQVVSHSVERTFMAVNSAAGAVDIANHNKNR